MPAKKLTSQNQSIQLLKFNQESRNERLH